MANLRRDGGCVINLPSADQLAAVERLGPLTGRWPVPASKPSGYRYEPDKFTAAQLTALCSELVAAPRVAECPVHLEATVQAIHPCHGADDLAIVDTKVLRVHAAPELVISGTEHVATDRWHPLFYVFRHYFTLGGPRQQLPRAAMRRPS